MNLRQQRSAAAFPQFHEPWLSGRLWMSVIIVLSLFLGYKAATLVFQVSGSAATQALLSSGTPTPRVYTDDGRATADNARGAVEAYLGFLADGDAESATKMAGPRAKGEDAIFLTNKVFSQAKEHISGVSVTSVDKLPAQTFDVHYSYTLAGTKHSVVMHLHRKTARWVFEPQVAALSVTPGRGAETTEFSISGVNTKVDNRQWATYDVYPAVYQIDAPTGGFFEGDSVVAAAWVDGDYKTFNLENQSETKYVFKASDKAKKLLQEATVKLLDDCLSFSKLFATPTTHGDWQYCRRQELEKYRDVSDVEIEVVRYPIAVPDARWPFHHAGGGMLNLSFKARERYSESNELQQITDLNIPISFSNCVAVLEDGKIVLQ